MLTDSQGLSITTESSETVNAINSFFEQLLNVGNNAEVIFKAVEADPACAIATSHAAAFYLFSGTSDAIAMATPYLNAAKAHFSRANEREQLYISAIDAWAKRDIQRAIAHHEVIAEVFPQDLISLYICQYHYRNSGDSEGMLSIAQKVLPANKDSSYMYGMLAFGLEECHRLSEAEEAARRAIEIKFDNRWAHHALAHVLEAQGRVKEGIAWTKSVCDTWEDSNPEFYSHLWWHAALYYLDAEDIAKVLKIYDTRIWGRARKGNAREQINAISLLLRLELRNINVGSRWQKIATYLLPRVHEHILGFMDLHYIYALVRGGKEDLAVKMLESIQVHAKRTLPYLQHTWAEIVLPAAIGMIAHAKGNWLLAIAQLGPVLPQLHLAGGSHAQRNLFEQVFLDALIHASEKGKALSLPEGRYLRSQKLCKSKARSVDRANEALKIAI